MLDGWLLHLIFHHLPPRDLIACGAVCKEFYAIARSDKAWQHHKERVLLYCPSLASVFDAHGQETDGKRVLQSKRQKQTPQGTWYIFARFLMRNPYTLAFERRKSKFAQKITSAVVEASILCLYYPEKRVPYNPWQKHCVNYKAKRMFYIHVVVNGQNGLIVNCDWMANTLAVTQRWQVRVGLKILATPFLSIVHDELEHFEKFRRTIFDAVK